VGTALKFDGHAPGDFTLDNFSPSYSPSGAGLLINDDAGSHNLTGTASNDTINAMTATIRCMAPVATI